MMAELSRYITIKDKETFCPNILRIIDARITDYEQGHENTLFNGGTFQLSKYDLSDVEDVPGVDGDYDSYYNASCMDKFCWATTPEGQEFWEKGFTYPSNFYINTFEENIIDGQVYII